MCRASRAQDQLSSLHAVARTQRELLDPDHAEDEDAAAAAAVEAAAAAAAAEQQHPDGDGRFAWWPDEPPNAAPPGD